MNIFKVRYWPKPIGSTEFSPIEAYVVAETWEDLVEYVHAFHGALISAESVNCAERYRADVLVTPPEFQRSLGKKAEQSWRR